MTAVLLNPPASPALVPGYVRCAPHVYRRRRLAAAVLVGTLVFTLSLLGGGLRGHVTGTPGDPSLGAAGEPVIYIVQPGDTLWGIAERLAPDGGDIRHTVDHLDAVTGGSLLLPGQKIILPAGW